MPAQSALSVIQFLAKHSIPTLPQPPLIDLTSPNTTFLYSLAQNYPAKKGVQGVEDIITNATKPLKVMPQTCFNGISKSENELGMVQCCARGLF
jgi:hypothetical protein